MYEKIKGKLIANLVDIRYVEIVRLPGIYQNACVWMVLLAANEPAILVFVGSVRIVVAELFTRRHREPGTSSIFLQL